ncbi:MAG: hypothetical protein KGN00_11730 [Chloroflexota bacterium]|nr:hypothetical protein [Chloroflexota bacterium]MDE3194347.1 hypothetical protein [Chloroflexota bacterium]
MEAPRRYLVRERPLSADDYDVPVGWWGWNWEPPVPMSLTEVLAAGNFDRRTAALCWLVLEAHGSMLIAAEQPHSGKTTTLTAFLDVLPASVRRIFIRGWAETFDYLRHTEPAHTILLANELSSHLPVYLWGPKAVETFRTLRRGYALASTLHADTAEEAVAQLSGDLGIDAADLARVDLLLVMRLFRAGTAYGPLVRRVVSVHRLVPDIGGVVRPLPLVEWDAERDSHEHDEAAEVEMLCLRRGGSADALRAEIARREAYLGDLSARGVTDIPAVRDALAEFRGEKLPRIIRGDPTA